MPRLQEAAWPVSFSPMVEATSIPTTPLAAATERIRRRRQESTAVLLDDPPELRRSLSWEPSMSGDWRVAPFLADARGSVHGMHGHSMPHNAGVWATTFNATNMLMGVGILSLPFGMRTAGWLGGAVLLLMTIATAITARMLGRCFTQLGLASFPDIGEAAFGLKGRRLISVVFYGELFMAAVIYIILEATNLQHLLPSHSVTWYAWVMTAIIWPTLFLTDLRLLSILATGGVICTLLVAAVLVYLSVLPPDVLVKPAETQLLGPDLSLSFGIMLVGYAGHSVFPSLFASMKEPEKLPRVLNRTYIVTFLTYAVVASFGYLKFGTACMQELTLNLRTSTLADTVIWLFVVNTYTKMPLTLLPFFAGVEESWRIDGKYKLAAARFFFRSAILALVSFIALRLPYFAYFSALTGSLMSTVVSLIFPAACYLKLFSSDISAAQRLGCYLLILLGLFCMAVGTYSAISGLVAEVSG
eukprot:PLAT12672.1.p1 GENE.PLAT12672.1~~PLAT12672.1.p1  ORF type:complete len:480 (-),score=146.65 PLAT12672.1:41-1456(-)